MSAPFAGCYRQLAGVASTAFLMDQSSESSPFTKDSQVHTLRSVHTLLNKIGGDDLSLADLLVDVCSIFRGVVGPAQPIIFYWDTLGRMRVARGLLGKGSVEPGTTSSKVDIDRVVRDLITSVRPGLSSRQLLNHVETTFPKLYPCMREVLDAAGNPWCVIGVIPERIRSLQPPEIEALDTLGQLLAQFAALKDIRTDIVVGASKGGRVRAFKSLFHEVSGVVSKGGSEPGILQSICELTVTYTASSLVCLARPNERGKFEFLASYGSAVGYLAGLTLSTSPEDPEGRGPAGLAWREGRIYYIESVKDSVVLSFWRQRAAEHQLNALAVLPIRRSGEMWAVLMVYHQDKGVFDDQFQFLLESLAHNISQGLDRFDHIRNKEASEAQQRLMAQALAAVDEGVIITDGSQSTLFTNAAFYKITGYSFAEMAGNNCNLLQGPDTDPAVRSQIRKAIDQGKTFSGEILNYRKSGQPFWNLLTISPIFDDQGKLSHLVGVQRDITHLRSLSEQLEHHALHDVLTGLPNRRALDSKLDDLLAVADRKGQAVAIGLIDIDDFRNLVDRFGHDCADEVLVEVARRLDGVRDTHQYLARVGGDEFVLVFRDLNPKTLESELAANFDRIGKAMNVPISMVGGQSTHISFSMGVSVYPRDERQVGSLLRLADEALHQAKKRKENLAQWWWIHDPVQIGKLQTEEFLNAYGADAVDLLEQVLVNLAHATDLFVAEFDEWLVVNARAKSALASLAEDEFEAFKVAQRKHLLAMLDTGKTRDEIRTESMKEGRKHALMGIDNALLIGSMGRYRQSILACLNRVPMLAQRRYQLTQIIEQRLQDQIQFQVEAYNEAVALYTTSLGKADIQSGLPWGEAISRQIEVYGRLPGIATVLLMRHGSDGAFKLEASSGPKTESVSEIFAAMELESPHSVLVHGQSSRFLLAWHSGDTVTRINYRLHTEVSEAGLFYARLSGLGVSSSMHVPLQDDSGKPFAMMTFLGMYPNQFESEWMRQFAVGVQRRARELWLRSTQPASAVSQAEAIRIKDALFASGLEMHFQPIIDLASGQPVKVEALARLRLEDGSLLGPGRFLPLLTDSELDRLFRHGLDQTLDLALKLRSRGQQLGVSLNLPPRTLMDAECRNWVRDALKQRQLPAEILTLELLETQELDPHRKDEVISGLVDLGVKLAMDDLGSGYSSLRRLATDPFDAIKVDQGLILRIREEPLQTMSLVSMIVQIGRDFGREVVIEGLEDEGMVEMARLMGANQGQGFGIARPMPLHALLEWLNGPVYEECPSTIDTLLGAVTFKWLTIQRDLKHTTDRAHCPLTEFIERQDETWAQAKTLHDDFHKNPGEGQAAETLLQWLVALYLSEGQS